jgi:hypothetical protein
MLPRSVSGELCRVRTEDGLELHGFLCPNQRSKGKGQKAESAERTGVLHVHGWDGNFYENRFIYEAARVCTACGLSFLSLNNRGHDYIADILRERAGSKRPETRVQRAEPGTKGTLDYLQLGGVYERMADCVPDIRS